MFTIGDVVMFMGHAYFVIDYDEDINLLILTDGISTTSEVDYEDVVKIGHDDTLERDIIDRLKNVQLVHEQDLLENKLHLIDCIQAEDFTHNGNNYTVTGKTKQDGNYFYCQIHGNNGYEWILMEELWDKFFK
jgi:hypothetical protein